MAYVMAFWRLASDLGVADDAGFTGVFAHWQPWMALAIAVHGSARVLARYGTGEALEVPIFSSFAARRHKTQH
jgi:hypothetical protein